MKINNFNSDEIFLSQSAFSPGPYNPNNQNDCNFLINQGTSNLYPYNSNAKETNFNYFTKKFSSLNSNLSESINSYTQFDFVYDTRYFTQSLECFHAISFLSTGTKIIPPQELKMIPYFKN